MTPIFAPLPRYTADPRLDQITHPFRTLSLWDTDNPLVVPSRINTRFISISTDFCCITPGPTQYLYLADSFPGRIYKMTLDGQVVGWLGKNGRLPKQFGWIHEIACPSENELLVAELLNWRMQKLTLHPDKTATSAAR